MRGDNGKENFIYRGVLVEEFQIFLMWRSTKKKIMCLKYINNNIKK